MPLEFDADGRFTKDVVLAPDKFLEVCGKLPVGQKVLWRFDATGRLNFNVHYHEGKKVTYPAKQDGVAQALGVLDPTAEQDYCWMWSNKGAEPARLKIELER